MSNNLKVPTSLFRFLPNKEIAEEFIRGRIRLGLMESYKSTEDRSRQDASEGLGNFKWDTQPTAVEATYVGMNSKYLLCTSHPDCDQKLLRQKFGAGAMVIINQPEVFMNRLLRWWKDYSYANGSAFLSKVYYDKGETRKVNNGLIAPFDISWAQKPRGYEDEQEYRYVLIGSIEEDTSPTVEQFVHFEIGDCSDIVSIMTFTY